MAADQKIPIPQNNRFVDSDDFVTGPAPADVTQPVQGVHPVAPKRGSESNIVQMDYNPAQPRDKNGRWTLARSGGGSTGESGGGAGGGYTTISSNDEHVAMMKKYGQGATPEQEAALKAYIGNDYSTINGHLTGRNPQRKGSAGEYEVNDQIDAISSYIDSHAIPVGLTVYRGANMPAGMEPGQVFSQKGFTSTSTSEGFAKSWMDGSLVSAGRDPVTLMEIRLPPRSKAAFVDNAAEREVLVQKGARMKILESSSVAVNGTTYQKYVVEMLPEVL